MGKKWYRGQGEPIKHKTCEATGKTIFESRQAALRAAHTAMKHRPLKLIVYQCDHKIYGGKPCYGWHMTSKAHRE